MQTKVEKILEIENLTKQAVQYRVIVKLLKDVEKALQVFKLGNNNTKTAQKMHDELLKIIKGAIDKANKLYNFADYKRKADNEEY